MRVATAGVPQAAASVRVIPQPSRIDELATILDVLRDGEVAPRHPPPDLGRLDALVESSRLAGVEVDLRRHGSFDGVSPALAAAAYTRVELVEKRGEFAVRGGILDVFPPTDEHPSRVEFWGDEIEEIRTFAVADQRTIDPVPRLWAPPCRELLLTPEVRTRAFELSVEHPELAEILDKLAQGIPVEGMESLAPALLHGTDSMELLIDCMPPGTHVLLCDPERIRTRAHDLTRTSEEFLEASWAAAAVGGQAPIDVGAAAFKTLGEVRAHAATLRQPWWTVSPFGLAEADGTPDDQPWLEAPAVEVSPDRGDAIALSAQPVPLYHGDTGRLSADLSRWAAEQWAIALVFEGIIGIIAGVLAGLRKGGFKAPIIFR